MAGATKDHGNSLAALQQACDQEDIAWLEQDVERENASQNPSRPSRKDISHTVLKSPNPKRSKTFPTEE